MSISRVSSSIVVGVEEPVHLAAEIEPTDPGMLARPRRKGHPRLDVAKTGPASEPDRRVVVLLNFHVVDAERSTDRSDRRARRRRPSSCRSRAGWSCAGSSRSRSGSPIRGTSTSPARNRRRRLTGVETAAPGVPQRVQRAHVGFAQHPALDAHHGEVFAEGRSSSSSPVWT